MLIKDVMVRNPVTVRQDVSVVDVKRVLEENKISKNFLFVSNINLQNFP